MIKTAVESFLGWFKRCRDNNEIILLKKVLSSKSEIATLKTTLSENQGDAEKITQRINELKQGLQNLPRGRSAFFFLYAFTFIITLFLMNAYFSNLIEFVKLNWENNPEYLMEFRATSVFCWQVWQWLIENSLVVPMILGWLLLIFVLQSRMLWYRAYNLIVVAAIVSFTLLFWLLYSFTHLSFLPLL